MRPLRKGSHTVYDLKVHLVWITKYRYAVLDRAISIRIREIIRQSCDSLDINIIKGCVSQNHIHLYISYPPKHGISDMVRKIKGRSSKKIQEEFPQLSKKYWGRHFWGRDYFSSTSGNVTDDVIDAYIDHHTEGHRSDGTENISLES